MIQKGYFIITDISGYTSYLSKSELDHAHEVLKSLLDAQIGQIKYPFTISNFQGDAIFMYVNEELIVQEQTLIELVESLYFTFVRKRQLVDFNTHCTCKACKNIPDLDLKIFIHYGEYIVQSLAGRDELMGSDVILAHKMMKNNVIDQTGITAYALYSQQAAERLHLTEYCENLIPYIEDYEHTGQNQMSVLSLKEQWKKEQEKTKLIVTKEEAWVSFESEILAPPLVVWDHLTKADIKLEILGFSEGGRVDDLGGRTREGSQFHCAHNELDFRYKVVDWRAFEYFTCYESGPMIKGLRYYNTYLFKPTEKGTFFANYVRYPEGGPIEETREFMQNIWDAAFPRVKQYIEDKLAKVSND